MIDLYLIAISATLGTLCHFLVRKSQGRTASTMKQYFKGNISYTITSVSSTITNIGIIYAAAPENLSGKGLALLFFAGFGAGYGSDSIFNKDPKPRLPK